MMFNVHLQFPAFVSMLVLLMAPLNSWGQTSHCGTSGYACLGRRQYQPCVLKDNGDWFRTGDSLLCDPNQICFQDGYPGPCVSSPPVCELEGIFSTPGTSRRFYLCVRTGVPGEFIQLVGACAVGFTYSDQKGRCIST